MYIDNCRFIMLYTPVGYIRRSYRLLPLVDVQIPTLWVRPAPDARRPLPRRRRFGRRSRKRRRSRWKSRRNGLTLGALKALKCHKSPEQARFLGRTRVSSAVFSLEEEASKERDEVELPGYEQANHLKGQGKDKLLGAIVVIDVAISTTRLE